MYRLNISINIFNEMNQEHLFKCVVREVFGINQRVSVHGCGQSESRTLPCSIISKNISCSLAPSFPPLIVCSAFLIQPLLCPVSFLPSQPSHPYKMPGSCS